MNPSVGRIVHYVSHGTPIRPDGTQAFTSECRAAVITETHENGSHVGLCVLNPTGMFFHALSSGGCEHDEGSGTETADWACDGQYHDGGSWHWPARVGETGP